ncbi:MAG: hypothetical protein HY673_04980 [Chloroflexi bacterium]|nr:hypothetical protein [Chloroflexota bacterium]
MDGFEQKLKQITEKLDAAAERPRAKTGDELQGLKVRGEIPRLEDSKIPRFPTTTPDLRVPPRRGPVNLTSELGFLDDLAEECFDFGRTLGRTMRTYPVYLCQSLDDFFGLTVKDVGMPEGVRAQVVQAKKREAAQQAEETGGGILGVHFPGPGCYLNGWLMERRERERDGDRDGHGGPQAGTPAAPAGDRHGGLSYWPEIVGTVIHEKFGHGFISEMSAWGRERRRLNLDRYDIARRFNLKATDSPAEVAMGEKYNLVYRACRICEEGYAEWIENYLWQKWHQGFDIRHGCRYGLDGLLSVLGGWKTEPAQEKEFADALAGVCALLLGDVEMNSEESPAPGSSRTIKDDNNGPHRRGRAVPPVFPAQLMEGMGVLGTADDLLGPALMSALGKPLHYVAGYLLVEKLARNLGADFVPYAVLIANNVTFDLERTSISDLGHLLQHTPELNINARLFMLAELKSDREMNLRQKCGLIKDNLGFAIPRFFGS